MVVNTTKHVNMDDLRRILSEIKYINLTEVHARDGQRESAVLELNLVIYPGHACVIAPPDKNLLNDTARNEF